jgi:predicted Zn finger-like uncharacterized protein
MRELIPHFGGGAIMPIPVTCPECGAAYRLADDLAGKVMKCKKCGAKVPIPAGAAKSGNGNGKGAAAAPKKGGGAVKVLLAIGGVFGLLAFCCCVPSGFGSWWLFWRSRPVVVINDASKDAFKDISQDLFKDLAKELAKDVPKDPFKDLAKDFSKDPFKDALKDAFKDLAKKIGNSPSPVAGTVVFNQQAFLSPKDPQMQGKPYKAFLVTLEQGKTYVIDMQSKELDSYLRLYDPANAQVAKDDDSGGGLNARITYTAKQAGAYQIHTTVGIGMPPTGGNFTLTVTRKD